MRYERAWVFVCPVCGDVKRYDKWLPYKDVKEHLEQHQHEWLQVDFKCPTCREKVDNST